MRNLNLSKFLICQVVLVVNVSSHIDPSEKSRRQRGTKSVLYLRHQAYSGNAVSYDRCIVLPWPIACFDDADSGQIKIPLHGATFRKGLY